MRPHASALLGETLQAVGALALSRRVPQARHVHGICRKARTLNAMVAQHVAIKAVVMPHFLDVVILKELLENGKHLIHCFLQERSITPEIAAAETL